MLGMLASPIRNETSQNDNERRRQQWVITTTERRPTQHVSVQLLLARSVTTLWWQRHLLSSFHLQLRGGGIKQIDGQEAN
jgi:hypothetical protein